MKIENKNTYLILFVVIILALSLYHVIYINSSNIYEETAILEDKMGELLEEVRKLEADGDDMERKVDLIYCRLVEEDC